MHRTRRMVLGAVASITAAGMLTGCAANSEENGDVELRMVMWTSSPAHLDLFQELADEFVANHPTVTNVHFESTTVGDHDTVLKTQLGSNTPPDLAWLPVETSLEYINAGALVNVEESLKSNDGYEYDDLVRELQEPWVTNDGQFGVPFSTTPRVLFYNLDLFEAADAPTPAQLIEEEDWNWESFREASKAISDTQDVPGYINDDFDFANWIRLLPLLEPYGASPWNDDNTMCTAAEPEMVDAMTLYHEMIYEDRSTPAPGQQADFWGGQAGSISANLSSNSLLEDAPFDWDLAPMPSGPAGDAQSIGQAAIVAFTAGENAEEATELLTFLTNHDSAAQLAQFFPPSRHSLLTPAAIADTSPLLTEDMVEPIIHGITETGEIFPVAKNAAAVDNALNQSLNEFVYGADADVSAGLEAVCQQLDPLLAE